jgi:hexulose-6-phosphate isomerase
MKAFTRRQFLNRSATALGAVATASATKQLPGALTEEDPGRYIYKSLKWNMVRLEGSVLEKFRVLKELGYDGVELDSPDDLNKAEAVAASQQTGLPVEGIVNATHWQIRHSDPDPAVRARARENMRTAMREAKQVGADSVLLVPGRVSDLERENHDQVWQRSIADIRELLPLAEELNVKILIENVGNGFCTDPVTFAQYIDEINSPWVGIHFDIGNHIRFSPPAEWIRVLGKRIRKLDVKDRRKTGRERVLIGEGDADWPAVRAALRHVGYRGWAAAEVEGGGREHLADVLRRMNEVLGESDHKPAQNLPGATRAAD